VHGHVSLHPACCLIIDTPQFQRLQKLLQLGPTQWVFAGATHKRFAHSIGVSYLAGRFVEDLRVRQPELGITDQDVLCVKLAGLCHDLGHGPLSHTYDGKFVRKARPGVKWDHEWTSAALFEHCLCANGLKPRMRDHWGLGEDDFHFVKELIFGAASEAPPAHVWKGRGINKCFLYEIVANHRNEIDVDKFDYFKRDCYHLGIPVSFDSDRLMRFSRVIFVQEDVREGLRAPDAAAASVNLITGTHMVPQIAYHEKEVWNIYELFHTRFNLHKRAYQHRVAHAVEKMLCDALLLVERSGLFWLAGTDGAKVALSHAMDDLEAYTHLNDSIFDTIRFVGRSPDSSSELRAALEKPLAIMDRIDCRKLYRHVSEILVPVDAEGDVGNEDAILREILDACDDVEGVERADLEDAEAYVDKFSLNYGMKWRNPVDKVLFYRRDKATEGVYKRKEHMSHLAPNKFQEFYVRLYLRSRDRDAHDAARRVFNAWCARKFVQEEGEDSEGGRVSSMVAPSPGRVAGTAKMKKKKKKGGGLEERERKRARTEDGGAVMPSTILPPVAAAAVGKQLP
jgi:HD superfamily phosphohydrolase